MKYENKGTVNEEIGEG